MDYPILLQGGLRKNHELVVNCSTSLQVESCKLEGKTRYVGWFVYYAEQMIKGQSDSEYRGTCTDLHDIVVVYFIFSTYIRISGSLK